MVVEASAVASGVCFIWGSMVVLLVLLPHSNKVLVSNPPGGFFCVEMHVFPVPVTQVSIAETTVVHSVCRAFPNSFLHLQKYIHKKMKI